MIAAVRQEQLEGVVAKRKDSLCEAGKRTGSWAKLRINRGQEFGGGFTPRPHGLDAIIVGYSRDKDLVYVARVRNGFVPRTRRMLATRWDNRKKWQQFRIWPISVPISTCSSRRFRKTRAGDMQRGY
jgi:ATP-dependent DNA ligase